MKKVLLVAAALIAACSPQEPTAQERLDRFLNAPAPSGVVRRPLMGGLHALCGVEGTPYCQDDAHATHAAYMSRDVGGADAGMCNNCHVGWSLDWFGSEFDPQGNRRPAFLAPTAANPNPRKPAFNGWSMTGAPVTGVYNCSNVACHAMPEHTYTSTFQAGDGTSETRVQFIPTLVKDTPVWKAPARSCTACHDAAPNAQPWHVNHANGSFAAAGECRTCHPNVVGAVATGLTFADPALHGNGVAEVQGRFRSGCFNCH